MRRLRRAALYDACLRLAPRRLRERHADEMRDHFLEELDAARARGAGAEGRVWARGLIDIAAAWKPASSPTPRGTPMIGTELRQAWRSLWRQRSSSLLALLMLALGIGANIVVFTFINGLLLKPFPFPEPDRLVYINETAPKWNLEAVGVNYPDFWQWHENNTLFESMAIYGDASFNLSDDRGAERIVGGRVSRDFVTVLGIQPILGRNFTADEDRPVAEDAETGALPPGVAMLSERLWRERFGSSPNVLGQTLRLNGRAHTIVGVLPGIAEFPDRAALWVPYNGDPNAKSESYGPPAMGRLKPGVTIEQAQADLTRAQEPIWKARDTEKVVSPFVRSLHDELTRDARESVPALGAAVLLLLVVACANVASVMLARAIARRREISIRLAIGAGRARLVRQLFIENALLAIAGTIAGVIIGRIGLRVLITSLELELPHWVSLSPDGRLVAFAAMTAVVSTVLFGLAPALHAVGGDLRGAMNDAVSGSTSAPRGRRTLSWLVGAEFALAAVLVVVAGLLIRAYGQVSRVDPGFQPDHVLMFRLGLVGPAYDSAAKRLAFWDNLLTRARATAGVEAAGLISCPPLGCHWGYFFKIEDRAPLKPGEPDPVVLTRIASEGYFDAMGISMAEGRQFDAADRAQDGVRAVIVNETFARTFWPGVPSVVGKHVSFSGADYPPVRVVGVSKDERHYGLEKPMRPGLFFPMSWSRTDSLVVAVRTAGEPGAFAADARRLVSQVDPQLPLYQVQTMEGALTASLRGRALYSWLIAIFATLALVLALGGTYGVTSYLVGQRRREIGIRIAIGAETRDVVRSVLRSSALSVLAGTVAGLAGAIALAGQLGPMLFGVKPFDPLVLGVSALVLLAAALSANWLPALRAARVNPSTSLRLT